MLANVVDMRYLGLMVSFILLVCVAGVLAQSATGAGKEVVPKDLKKLFDPIEELRREPYEGAGVLQETLPLLESKRELKNVLIKKEICSESALEGSSVQSSNIAVGSFTRRNTSQIFANIDCGFMTQVFALFESDSLLAVYSSSKTAFSLNATRDVNQNGLSELLIKVQSDAKRPYGEMQAIQLIELKNKKPIALGNFFVGGHPQTNESGEPPLITCTPTAPKELRKHFPANIIYVRKGKSPQYFAEPYNISCSFLDDGNFNKKNLIATKLGPITPIKPVMRPVILERIY